ncbi:transcriptional regulator GcvA [Rhodobacteraceae bacterium NNCM2]|nr:transcriptional regulator GcvA [Coraliihabitans acroporae]
MPPLNSLRAFEAAARLGSFLEAARELNVTPAAISHQIKTLEADLDLPLFHRLPRGIRLTDAGRELLPDISRGFAHFGKAMGAISSGTLGGKLTISAAPSFATLWLVPRLGRFLRSYPEIQVQVLSAGRVPADLNREEADLRIPYGAGDYPGLVTNLLMRDTIFPVCAPSLLNRQPLRGFADLRHHVLLQDVDIDSAEPTMTWRRWFNDAGIHEHAPAGWVEFNEGVLVTEAAVRGQGVALGRLSLVREHLKTGRLMRPLKTTQPSEYNYYTVTTAAGAQRPRIRAFLRWLEEEVRRDNDDSRF